IRTSPNQDDFLGEAGGLSIKNGVLNVQINLFMSAGGWDAGSRTFRFRHQGGQFKLIGFDSSNVHRGSGETTDVSVNYLNRKAKVATGSIENDIVKTKWSRLPKQPLLTIQQVGNGLEFEPGL
ncbi:MAG: hypothetical protein OER56_16635, partial [Hyphomicrobiales bacterium]|nr:hypothetical protein [Hyphomicrobiales bacterium]